MSGRLRGSLLAIALSPLALAGCVAPANTGSTADILPDSLVAPLVDAVPQRTVTPLPPARLADGLIPPTNRWFSGLVFGDESLPVFPLPLSFRLSDGGFEFGVPTVAASPKVITGGFVADVSVDVGADLHVVTAYDEASITITHRAGGVDLGRTIIAEGSPFVSFTASEAVTVHLGTAFSAGAGTWTASVDGTEYGLVSAGTLSGAGTALTLREGQVATWFALATGGSLAEFAAAAAHPILGTSVSYTVTDDRASTSIAYATEAGTTLIAAMPHQYDALADRPRCRSGTYDSVYGQLRVCAVSELSWSVPTVTPVGSIDLSRLDDAQTAQLVEQVNADLSSTPPSPTDTYFGGKWLYRLANLLSVARQVGADDAASAIKTRIVDALDRWMEPSGCTTRSSQCFVYDAEAKGMVGLEPSFGSDQFNDHHFHYGYLLYAAGVVAADDPELVMAWAPVMNLLAADLATEGDSAYFPQRRVFDAYAGHSWASGTAPFLDGNNQESSSEAVTAWNGLALWAAASGQDKLETEATWMLSAEAASALAYWTNFPLDAAVYDGFDHAVTSLNWGGKRDYATWFSPEPSAMLGILILPMSPVAAYLGADTDRIKTNIAEAAPSGFDVLFGDYLLMYSALAGPDAAAAALSAASSLRDERIDDGNSRSYLLAWILSRT
jgi:endo-1,3(4)-beta-glucanase